MPSFNGTNNADFFPVLKEWAEDPNTVNELLFEDNPTMGLMPTSEDAQGKYITVPLNYSSNPGGGANFGLGLAQQRSGRYAEFQVPLSEYFQFARVDQLTAESSRSNQGAFESVFKTELEAAMVNYGNNLAMQLWGVGNGTRGYYTPNTGITAGVITLANSSDAIRFNLDQTLALIVSGSPLAALGYVISVNPGAGTVTVSATPGGVAGTPTNWDSGATTGYLVQNGDYNNLMVGIPGYIVGGLPGQTRPGTGQPSSVNVLLGVDRSPNPDLLAGVYIDASRYSITDALIQSAMQARRIGGGKQDVICVNPITHAELQKEQSGKQVYTDVKGPTGFMYKALTVNSGTTDMAIIPDRFLPSQVIYGLDFKTWVLASAGKVGKILTYQDGIDWFRDTNTNSTTLRYGGYPAVLQKNPGRNFVAKVAV